MPYSVFVCFSLSVWAPALLGLVKMGRIDRSCYPFLILMGVASVNELISLAGTIVNHTNAVNNNLYVLAEGLLITWQFHRWHLFRRSHRLFYGILALVAGGWLTEYHSVEALEHIGKYYRPLCSALVVFMSVQHINTLIFSFSTKLRASAEFIICAAFIIYFTFKILVEVFWIYGLTESKDFRVNVYLILSYINFFVNILYIIAVLCMPTKKYYIRLS